MTDAMLWRVCRGARRRWRTTIKTIQATNRLKSFSSSASNSQASTSTNLVSSDDDDDEQDFFSPTEDGNVDKERVLGGGPEAQVVENEKEDERKKQRGRGQSEEDKKVDELAQKVSAVEV